MNKIVDYIKTLSSNQKIQELLIQTVGNLLLKQENSEKFIKDNEDKINHIRDWIHSIVENNEEWKTPRVLTIEALNNAADKYFNKKNNKLQTIELDENHEKLIADLGDYYVVQMLTPEALDNESKVMQHCIGHGWYDRKLNDDKYKFLSLRDKFNKAHITLEIENEEILQMQGKQNKLFEQKYLEVLCPWLINNQYKLDLSRFNLIYNKKDNKIYSIDDIPDNCEIIYDFVVDSKELKRFPENLKINGDFYFSYKSIDYIHKSLIVDGYIILCDLKIKRNEIPDELFIEEKLKIDDFFCWLVENNYNLELFEYDLIYNANDKKIHSIFKIPNNCIINDNLSLAYFKYSKLPNYLTINGSLDLNNSFFHEFPENLVVNGDIYLKRTYIKEIPDDIKINGSIIASESWIENIPENFVVNGDFDLSGCEKIKILPDNLTVNGNLNLNNASIKKISRNCRIKNSLHLEYSGIKELPDDLKCKKIVIDINQINIIKECLKFEKINIARSSPGEFTKEEFFKKFFKKDKKENETFLDEKRKWTIEIELKNI